MDDKTKQLVMDFKSAFSTQAGQNVLADLEEKFGYKSRILPGAMADFNLGKRDAYLYIIDKVDADLDKERQEMALTEPEEDE